MKRTFLHFTVLLSFLIGTLSPGLVHGASAASSASVAGTYVNKQNNKEYLTLRADGTFTLKQQRKPYDMEHPYMTLEGSYKLDGEKVLLNLRDGGEAEGKIQDNAFVDGDGKLWVNEKLPGPKKDEEQRPSRRKNQF